MSNDDDGQYYSILEVFARENNSNGGDDDSKKKKIQLLLKLFNIGISKEEEDKILTLVKNEHFIKLMNDVKQESGWRPEVVKYMKRQEVLSRFKTQLYEEFKNGENEALITKLRLILNDFKPSQTTTLNGFAAATGGGGSTTLNGFAAAAGQRVLDAAKQSTTAAASATTDALKKGTTGMFTKATSQFTGKPQSPMTNPDSVEIVQKTEPDPDCKHAEKIVRDALSNVILDKGSKEYELITDLIKTELDVKLELKTKEITKNIIDNLPDGAVKTRLIKKFKLSGGNHKTKRRNHKTKRRNHKTKRRK